MRWRVIWHYADFLPAPDASDSAEVQQWRRLWCIRRTTSLFGFFFKHPQDWKNFFEGAARDDLHYSETVCTLEALKSLTPFASRLYADYVLKSDRSRILHEVYAMGREIKRSFRRLMLDKTAGGPVLSDEDRRAGLTFCSIL